MKRLLLVDDNLDFLDILAKVLAKNYEIIQATKVCEACIILDNASVDALCTDYNLPDGTGIDIIEYANVPFLLMSGSDASDLRLIAQKLGGLFSEKTSDYLLDNIKSLV